MFNKFKTTLETVHFPPKWHECPQCPRQHLHPWWDSGVQPLYSSILWWEIRAVIITYGNLWQGRSTGQDIQIKTISLRPLYHYTPPLDRYAIQPVEITGAAAGKWSRAFFRPSIHLAQFTGSPIRAWGAAAGSCVSFPAVNGKPL